MVPTTNQTLKRAIQNFCYHDVLQKFVSKLIVEVLPDTSRHCFGNCSWILIEQNTQEFQII